MKYEQRDIVEINFYSQKEFQKFTLLSSLAITSFKRGKVTSIFV